MRRFLWHTIGTLAASNRRQVPQRGARKCLSYLVKGGVEWWPGSTLNLLVVGSTPTRPTIYPFADFRRRPSKSASLKNPLLTPQRRLVLSVDSVAGWGVSPGIPKISISVPRCNERIVRHPSIHHGKLVIRGTRLPVSTVIGSLAGGMTSEIRRRTRN